MIWIKTLSGIKAWCYRGFNRKSVERYFIYTFVYHIYTIFTNTLMFSLQFEYYGEWIVPNIVSTILIGGTFIMTLYYHLKHKDREQHKH